MAPHHVNYVNAMQYPRVINLQHLQAPVFIWRYSYVFALFLAMFFMSPSAQAIEEAEYEVIRVENRFELRKYSSHIVAETIVTGDLEGAGKSAFSQLFDYISGNNYMRAEIEMTSPVTQTSSGHKIAMTAPERQQRSGEDWAVSFMMPASYSMDTLPLPNDPRVILREIPERYVAAVRYSGFWNEENYNKYEAELISWIEQQNLETTGNPIWARYNSPFSLWFMRRNEILIPVNTPGNR